MKTLLISVLAILNLNAFAQGVGSVIFGNTAANPVFLCDGRTPVPRGALGGTYMVELLTALDGADFRSTATRAGATTTFNTPVAGVFSGGWRTVPTVQQGGFGQFQVRVWDSRAGATYEAAWANGDVRYQLGESPILTVDTADPWLVPTPQYAPLYMPSFALSPPGCPEPSTYALFLLGAGALWFFRRCK